MPNILIIDDDPEILKWLADSLKTDGFKVLTAGSGIEGLEQARRHHPDVVLCDIDMPEPNGYEMLKALRNEPQTADIPLVFLTGMSQPADFRKGMAIGAENYLPKPVSKADLLAALATCLQKAAQQKQREDDRISQLAGDVARTLSHELRTPLTGIVTIPDLMEACDHDSDPTMRDSLRGILRQSGERLHRAVDRFLFYSDLWALSQRRETSPLGPSSRDLEPLLGACACHLAEVWSRPQDVRVTGSAPVNLDSLHLEYLAGEIIDNAFKFSPAGTPVAVEIAVANGGLFLRVADQGRGMAEAEINALRVFRQFDRATHEQQGFGLGLAIVQLLVRHYRGEFAIQSQPGQSTVVTVRLPVSDSGNPPLRP